MTRADEILERSLTPLLSTLNSGSGAEWIPQVNLFSGANMTVCLLTDGFPDDPIEGLEQFGRDLSNDKPVDGIVVIAESVDDELICSAADAVGNIAMAFVAKTDEKWDLRRKVASADMRVKTKRFPAAAVWRGIYSIT